MEDLILAAYNEAHAKVDTVMADGMKDVTSGLNLGGLKLPFKVDSPWLEKKLKTGKTDCQTALAGNPLFPSDCPSVVKKARKSAFAAD